MTTQHPRTAVLAYKNDSYVAQIVSAIESHDLSVSAVFVASRLGRLRARLSSVRRVWQAHGMRDVMYYFLERDPAPRGDTVHPPAPEAPVFEYDDINDRQTVTRLNEIGPHVLMLAGCPIIRHAVIDCAELGCLNAHPAWLPGARGLDVVEWALVHGRPLGVTVHLVTPKVDAGDIVHREELKPNSGETWAYFRNRVSGTQARHLASAARKLVDGTIERTPHDLNQSTLYHVASRSVRVLARERFTKLTGVGS